MRRPLLALAAALSLATPAFAAEGVAIPSQSWSFNGIFGTFDRAAAQRGFQVYREVCASCHGLRQVAFRNLTALGYSMDEVRAVAAAWEPEFPALNDSGEPTTRPGVPADRMRSRFPNDLAARAANNGALPPDLSLITKARVGGPDYVFALLTGYSDPPAGVTLMDGMNYNTAFPGHQIAMVPPLPDGRVTRHAADHGRDGARRDDLPRLGRRARARGAPQARRPGDPVPAGADRPALRGQAQGVGEPALNAAARAAFGRRGGPRARGSPFSFCRLRRRLRTPIDHLVMRRALVEALEHGARRGRHVAHGIVLADEGLDRGDVVEPHDGRELDLVGEGAAHQVDVAEAGHAHRLDSGDHLAAHDRLVRGGIRGRGPAAPDPADHLRHLSWPPLL
jgi:ubiquinol-cytochrome c reductase cytochrome c1 subunit